MLRINRAAAAATRAGVRTYSASPALRSGVRVPNLATFKLPEIGNEPTRDYRPGSAEQEQLMAEVAEMGSKTHAVPLVINGREVHTGNAREQRNPGNKAQVLCRYQTAGPKEVAEAIEGAVAARSRWEAMPL
ncbi:1-pyrroline-5-carboxylate dehydrogenase, partial [Coemansia nantahalensis]